MNESILFISHEATLTGAPILLLNLIKEFRSILKQEFIVVLGKDGPLRHEFEKLSTVIIYEQNNVSRLRRILSRQLGPLVSNNAGDSWRYLRNKNIQLIFSNTIANGRFLDGMQLPSNIPVITYVHELRFTMNMQEVTYGDINSLIKRTDYFLAGSNAVRKELLARGVKNEKIQIVYSSINIESLDIRVASIDALTARNELNLKEENKLVIAVGTASWRKGSDWFVEMAAQLFKQHSALRFAWVGVSPNTTEYMQMSYDIHHYGLENIFTLVPVTPNYLNYLILADVFVLSSREDPFPLVVLEAALVGKPTVCFADAGGSPEFIEEAYGTVVPYGDVPALAEAVESLLDNPAESQAMGRAAREAVMQRYNINEAATQICKLINQMLLVSV